HGRMAMAETVYRPSLDEIQVSLAGVILEPRTFASHEDKLRTRNDIHQSSHTSPIKFHVDFPYEQKKVSGTEPLAEEILARPYRAIMPDGQDQPTESHDDDQHPLPAHVPCQVLRRH